MPLVKVFDAATVYKHLNGIINVYKPAGMKWIRIKNALLHNICRDLNELQVREPNKLANAAAAMPLLEPGGAANPLLRKIAADADLSDHVLAAGARYQQKDISCAPVAGLGEHSSGVLLFGINKGIRQSCRIQRNRPIRAYHLTGCLGTATESHLPNSLVTMRAKFAHVNAARLSGLVASLQASHQRKMYELCGVDLQSQAAYEIACKGLFRPSNNSQPVVYGIKLIEFNRPHFTLEVHAVNECEAYLATLVHEIAIELKTVAHCSAIRCIRHGQFQVESALLRHGWNLRGVMKNMREQQEVLKAHPYLIKQNKIELRRE